MEDSGEGREVREKERDEERGEKKKGYVRRGEVSQEGERGDESTVGDEY